MVVWMGVCVSSHLHSIRIRDIQQSVCWPSGDRGAARTTWSLTLWSGGSRGLQEEPSTTRLHHPVWLSSWLCGVLLLPGHHHHPGPKTGAEHQIPHQGPRWLWPSHSCVSVYIVYILLSLFVYCLLSSVYEPYPPRPIPCWWKILLGNKSVSDSDSVCGGWMAGCTLWLGLGLDTHVSVHMHSYCACVTKLKQESATLRDRVVTLCSIAWQAVTTHTHTHVHTHTHTHSLSLIFLSCQNRKKQPGHVIWFTFPVHTSLFFCY